jgi:hypothetical protein
MHDSKQVPHTPLLTPEELDALIQAYNRRDSVPGPRPGPVSLLMSVAAVLTLALGWWWG